MIAFSCPKCNRKLTANDSAAGKQVKCPACASVVPVPDTPSSVTAGQTAGRPQPYADSPPDRTQPTEVRGLSQPPTTPDAPTLSPACLPVGQGTTSDGGPLGQPACQGQGEDRARLTDFLAPPQAPDEIGRLGPYRVLKVLGAGGMGAVYAAEDPQLKRQVALKVMLPALAVSESSRKRFLREAQTAAAIEHDHIVAIYQVGEDRGVPFLAMPLLKGESLDDRLKHQTRLPTPEVLRIGREIAEGLQAAHERGLIHRDIKPANIWLEGSRARVKLLDFGLARSTQQESGLTQQGAILGTPAYMAPEQATGNPVDARCDLFSLGCVLYRLCTGEKPFQGKDAISTLLAVTTEQPRPIEQLNPTVPPALIDLVMRLLAKDPAQRPPSAQAVGEAIGRLEADPTISVSRPSSPPVPDRAPRPASRRRRPLVLGAALLAVVATGALMAFLLHPGGSSDEGTSPGEANKTVVSAPPANDGKEPVMQPDKPPAEWQPLFNGKNLDGWKVNPADRAEWTVKNGILTARGGGGYLYTQRDDFENFHFRVEARINERGNSGQMFRTNIASPVPRGYEAQISYGGDPVKTGSLFPMLLGKLTPEEKKSIILTTAPHKPDEWFTQEVIAEGNHIVIQLNGRTTVDFRDKRNLFQKGHLALQHLNPSTVVEFRKVEVKELPPSR